MRKGTASLRQHYWNPRDGNPHFVDATHFLYAFCLWQEAGTWSDLHAHSDYGELYYYSSGNSVLCSARGNFACNPLRAVWVPPRVEHEWYLPAASFDRALFVHESAVAHAPRFQRLHMLEISPLIRELIFALAELKPDLSSPPGERLGRVLLDRLEASPTVASPLSMPHTHRLVELCAKAVSSPDAPICIEDWSKQMHVSAKTLARMFVRETGMTMGRWVQSMRLHHAMQRMEGGESVTTAALDSGYGSVSAFINAFKKSFGLTPGEFSRRCSGERAAF